MGFTGWHIFHTAHWFHIHKENRRSESKTKFICVSISSALLEGITIPGKIMTFQWYQPQHNHQTYVQLSACQMKVKLIDNDDDNAYDDVHGHGKGHGDGHGRQSHHNHHHHHHHPRKQESTPKRLSLFTSYDNEVPTHIGAPMQEIILLIRTGSSSWKHGTGTGWKVKVYPHILQAEFHQENNENLHALIKTILKFDNSCAYTWYHLIIFDDSYVYPTTRLLSKFRIIPRSSRRSGCKQSRRAFFTGGLYLMGDLVDVPAHGWPGNNVKII